MVELDKKFRFLKKYRSIKPFIEQLCELLGNRAEFVLIYGSFARFSAEKSSDLDLLLVGEFSREDKNRISEIFVTFERELSAKIETLDEFVRKIDDPLHYSILEDHVVLCGERRFIKTLSQSIK